MEPQYPWSVDEQPTMVISIMLELGLISSRSRILWTDPEWMEMYAQMSYLLLVPGSSRQGLGCHSDCAATICFQQAAFSSVLIISPSWSNDLTVTQVPKASLLTLSAKSAAHICASAPPASRPMLLITGTRWPYTRQRIRSAIFCAHLHILVPWITT